MNQAQAAAHSPTATEVDVATVIAKTITDWQSYSGQMEAVDHVDSPARAGHHRSRCTSGTANS